MFFNLFCFVLLFFVGGSVCFRFVCFVGMCVFCVWGRGGHVGGCVHFPLSFFIIIKNAKILTQKYKLLRIPRKETEAQVQKGTEIYTNRSTSAKLDAEKIFNDASFIISTLLYWKTSALVSYPLVVSGLYLNLLNAHKTKRIYWWGETLQTTAIHPLTYLPHKVKCSIYKFKHSRCINLM